MEILRLAMALSLLVLAGCSNLQLPTGAAPTPAQATLSASTATPAAETATPASQPSATPKGPLTLRVWLPPQFDPNSGTAAGELLKGRLEGFSARRPGVRVEVRIKTVEGPGGLLDSLVNTSAAAPLALPDLVALPYSMLETAALKGLLHSFDGLTAAMEDPDWYEYARQLAQLQSSTYGLPFAGDALVLVYRPTAVSAPPADWKGMLEMGKPLVFPAADPQALFTLAMYQSAGGAVRDEQSRPALDVNNLSQVFTFYQDAGQSGLITYSLSQYQDDQQVWAAFIDQQADIVATWASRYLGGMLADTASAPIPTPEGQPFTLGDGWVWALATPQADRQALGTQLAEYLSESSFLAQWTEEVGYLPPRPSALGAWKNTSLQAWAGPVAVSARLYPPSDVLTSLGTPLQQATLQVLKQQSDPLTAAQAAADSLAAP